MDKGNNAKIGYLGRRIESRRVRGSEDIHIYYISTTKHTHIYYTKTYLAYKSIIHTKYAYTSVHLQIIPRTTCIFINAYILIARFPGLLFLI
jgi:hypothetical protein